MPGPKHIGIVTATSLNIRPEPSVVKFPVGSLKRGDAVEILDRVGGWYKIAVDGVERYIHGDYVTIQEVNHASGFLFELDVLKLASLEPEDAQKIPVSRDITPVQKLIARLWNAQGNLLRILADAIDIEHGAAVAVLCVESGGKGFNADGAMVIRFENHVFKRQLGNDGVFDKHFRYDTDKRWLGHTYRTSPTGKWRDVHESQSSEWASFTFARTLNQTAAMRSISMGAPQIMGFNHARIGYESVKEMFDAFQHSVRFQTIALFDFIQGPGTTSPMVVALQRKRFADFAMHYNGPGQAARYGDLIEGHVEAFNLLRT